MLKNSIDIAIYHIDETVIIELETGIQTNGKLRECDIVVEIKKGDLIKKLPIEMKCYRTKSSSGGNRGGQDLFKHGIYEDLELLENYANELVLLGVQLSMCDSRQFVHPKNKKGKSWNYDISDETEIRNEVIFNTPINGKPVLLKLFKRYKFKWNEVGNFYFLKLQGI
jgi:small nuclear ribonucleoprotein (snRNP)-like protein